MSDLKPVERLAKGWLNGTSRGQAYGLLALTVVIGAASGVAGTVAVIKRKYVLVEKADLDDRIES